MKRMWLGILVAAVLAPVGARGQLALQLEMDRDTRLLYESIPISVSVRNSSGRTIELSDSGARSWLELVVTDEDGRTVAAVGRPRHEESVLLGPGQTLRRTVDLLPLFDLRARGTYRVRAELISGSWRAASQPVSLTIMHGREIWTQTVGLPVGEGEEQQWRTYSLVVRRDGAQDQIYAGVRDDVKGLVYGMLQLGVYIALEDPDARVDRTGQLHLVYRNGPRSFGYARIDPEGRILERAAYSDMLSRPRLRADPRGVVTVEGGEKNYPRMEHVMSPAEWQAPPTPPKPAPKPRKSWWSRRTPESAATNAPSSAVPQP